MRLFNRKLNKFPFIFYVLNLIFLGYAFYVMVNDDIKTGIFLFGFYFMGVINGQYSESSLIHKQIMEQIDDFISEE